MCFCSFSIRIGRQSLMVEDPIKFGFGAKLEVEGKRFRFNLGAPKFSAAFIPDPNRETGAGCRIRNE